MRGEYLKQDGALTMRAPCAAMRLTKVIYSGNILLRAEMCARFRANCLQVCPSPAGTVKFILIGHRLGNRNTAIEPEVGGDYERQYKT